MLDADGAGLGGGLELLQLFLGEGGGGAGVLETEEVLVHLVEGTAEAAQVRVALEEVDGQLKVQRSRLVQGESLLGLVDSAFELVQVATRFAGVLPGAYAGMVLLINGVVQARAQELVLVVLGLQVSLQPAYVVISYVDSAISLSFAITGSHSRWVVSGVDGDFALLFRQDGAAVRYGAASALL